MLGRARRSLTVIVACGCQVCRDLTRILIERVKRLQCDRQARQLWEIWVEQGTSQFHTQFSDETVQFGKVTLAIALAEPKKSKEVASAARAGI